jgi:hypothetical protein
MLQVPYLRSSLNSGDVYILDMGIQIYQWNGAESSGMAVSFIGGGNWSTQKKPPTCHKSLTNNVVSNTP